MDHKEENPDSVEVVVLASGSSGNACVLKVGDFGLLIDAGLGPRNLAGRLKRAGMSWPNIKAAILTHTHRDHWNDRTLGRLSKMGIPFYCHREHEDRLSRGGCGVAQLRSAKLLHFFEEAEPLQFPGSLLCRPVPVRHDSGAAFGFRFERPESLFGPGWAMGFASDLGSWDNAVADALANVHLLALEFNHDEKMQKQSRRPSYLIERVLGDDGHLSNRQAAALTAEIVNRSAPNRLQTLIQLHLSRDCNRPELAKGIAASVLEKLSHPCEIHAADQHHPLRVNGRGVESRGAVFE